ncbi:MAG: hypothetical protein ACREBS_07850 [Nitrososphaerales archaeon]
MGNGGSMTMNPAAGEPCTMGAGGTSETISQAAIMLALIQVGILYGAILGASGIIRAHSKLTSFAAIILLAESVPPVFDGLFVFTIVAAGFFLRASRASEVQVRSTDSTSINPAKKA